MSSALWFLAGFCAGVVVAVVAMLLFFMWLQNNTGKM